MEGDDQYELGRLAQAVKTLTHEVTELRRDVASLRDNLNRGRGFFVGLMIAAGGVGAGASKLIARLFG